MNSSYSDSDMIIIDHNTIYCKRGICTKFGNGDVLCEDCQMQKQFEDRHKILCAGCEHRQKAMSDASSTSHVDKSVNTLEYSLNRGETYAEFTPNNGEFVTIFYEGTWEYEDIFTPYSFETGIWTLNKEGEVDIESQDTTPLSEHIKSLIERALKELGYVKSVAFFANVNFVNR